MGHKVCTELEDDLFLRFKGTASKKGKFTRGYTSQALRHAVIMYIWFNETHPAYEDLIEIAEKKYPDKDFKEIIKITFNECYDLYLKENKNYL